MINKGKMSHICRCETKESINGMKQIISNDEME